jgi:hypothetical protein
VINYHNPVIKPLLPQPTARAILLPKQHPRLSPDGGTTPERRTMPKPKTQLKAKSFQARKLPSDLDYERLARAIRIVCAQHKKQHFKDGSKTTLKNIRLKLTDPYWTRSVIAISAIALAYNQTTKAVKDL